MNQCPDRLTIQAYVDREEQSRELADHLDICPHCRPVLEEMRILMAGADSLKSMAVLPGDFYRKLANDLAPRPFPAALVAAALFVLTFLSAYLLNPDGIWWWLSVGMTRQFSFFLDTILDLLFMSHLIGPSGVIAGLAALVALEVFILNLLNSMEGKTNVQ